MFPAPAIVSPLWLDQLRMGVISVDDYPDVQTAIDAAINTETRQAKAKIFVPPGIRNLDVGLNFANVTGLVFSGSGPKASLFQWTGNDSADHMFEVLNCSTCLFENFGAKSGAQVGGSPVLGAIIRSRNDAGSPANTKNQYQNLTFEGTNGGYEHGIFWDPTGAEDTNNDVATMTGVHALNPNSYGFFVDHSQAKIHTFIGCSVSNGINGVRFSAGVRWYGGTVQNVTGAAFHIRNINDTLIIQGAGMEGCNRLLDTTGGSGLAFPVNISGCKFATNKLNADGKVIVFNHSGTLIFVGNIFSGDNPVIIEHSPLGPAGSHDVILGNHFNVELGVDPNPFSLAKPASGAENEALIRANTFRTSFNAMQVSTTGV